MFLHLCHPAIDVDEALFVANIEDNNDSVSSFVVSVGDSAVPFLACGVPYLEFNCGFVDLQSSEAEINTNCRDVVFLEAVVLEGW